MRPDRLSEFFGDTKVTDIIDRCGTNEKITIEITKQAGIKVTRQNTSSAPGFLDSIIILLVSAALIIFLLWATSRTLGVDAFEHLPSWLENSYHAIWTAIASGAAGIGLAIVQVLTRKAENPRPNYLLYILGTTVLLLLLILVLPRAFSKRDSHRAYVDAQIPGDGRGVPPFF